MRHRILQFAGKRYSIKLDEIVWATLEQQAVEAGVKLNQLVAQVAGEVQGASTLTDALRLFCLRNELARVGRLQGELQDRRLTSRGVPISVIAEACPAPALVVSHGNLILRANAAAQRWLGVDEAALTGKALEHYIQVRATVPLPAIVERFAAGDLTVFSARLVYLRPGRVVTARANLCPGSNDTDPPTYLVLVDTPSAG